MDVCFRHVKGLKETENNLSGFINRTENFTAFMNDLNKAGFSFVVRTSRTGDKNGIQFQRNGKIGQIVEFCGCPFKIVKTTNYECSKGVNYRSKSEKKVIEELNDHPQCPKKRRFNQSTKKIGCVATMQVLEVFIFIEHIIETYNPKGSPQQTKIINEIRSSKEVKFIKRYYVSIDKHHNHTSDKYDQEELEILLHAWSEEYPEDSFYFRPSESNDFIIDPVDHEDKHEYSTLLLVHQTKWQRDMLSKYGNNICLLDATYKTTKYSPPLFFIAVKTNIGYSVVATFVVQSVSTALIAEAIFVIKEWNPDWDANFFMTDFAEIDAIEKVFPEAKVYLCYFHMLQAWNRWLSRNGNVEKEFITLFESHWCEIADSETEVEYLRNLKAMEDLPESDMSPRAIQYFQSEWLPHKQRWVQAYQTKDFLSKIRTNDGIETLNKVLQRKYLKRCKDKTLSGMFSYIVKDFLPNAEIAYIRANNKINSELKKYSENVPTYLHGFPTTYINHVMKRLQASANITKDQITFISEGIFQVESEQKMYDVDFDKPSCSCLDFKNTNLICKHICAIITHIPNCTYEKIGHTYHKKDVTCDISQSQEIAIDVPETPAENEILEDEEIEVFCDADNDNNSLLEAQEKCRASLNNLINYTYISNDENILLKLAAVFEKTEAELVTLQSNEELTLNTLNMVSEDKQYLDSPPRKRKNSSSTSQSNKGQSTITDSKDKSYLNLPPLTRINSSSLPSNQGIILNTVAKEIDYSDLPPLRRMKIVGKK